MKMLMVDQLFEQEVYVWSKMRHPNVLSLMGFALCSDTGYPLLISLWMDRGSAWMYIMANPHWTLMYHARVSPKHVQGHPFA